MAILKQNPVVTMSVDLTLSEEEAKALDALVGYDTEKILKVFYEHLGTYYLQPHEEGMRSFLRSSREVLPCLLKKLQKARDAFEEK